MPATIVVGGQYGSEGKGKTVAILASRARAPWIVRCGGPNSGHTVTIKGNSTILRQVPSSSEPDRATFCISAGCVVDVDILLRELAFLEVEKNRIVVDPRAVIVTESHRQRERDELEGIASTFSGTGAALVDRMSRKSSVLLAGSVPLLRERCRVELVAPLLHNVLDDGGDVFIEGTQGFALSLLHGPDFPYVTARDTTAAGFAMEVGLSPLAIDRVVLVLRTFPIRVGGTSGPFANETTWEKIQDLSGAPQILREFTSVTKRLRRVAHFDEEAVRRACAYNRPTSLAVMGLDRLDFLNCGVTDFNALTPRARKFIEDLEFSTGVHVSLLGTGFGTFDVVDMDRQSHAKNCFHA